MARPLGCWRRARSGARASRRGRGQRAPGAQVERPPRARRVPVTGGHTQRARPAHPLTPWPPPRRARRIKPPAAPLTPCIPVLCRSPLCKSVARQSAHARLASGGEQRASHQQRTLLLLTNCSFDTNVLTCWAGGSGSLYPVWQLATGCKQVGDNGWGWVWSVGLSLLVMIIELVMRGLCFGGGACYCSSKLVDFLHSQGEERATVEDYRVVLVEGWVDTEVSRSSRF